MTVLNVTSLEPGAGKTALSADLGKRWQILGKGVGFFKSIALIEGKIDDEFVDRDVKLIKAVLGLEESVAELCPVAITLDALDTASDKEIKEYVKKIRDSYRQISKGKDIVITEGLGQLGSEGRSLELSKKIADALKAKTVVIARHRDAVLAEKVISVRKAIGDGIVGIVINAVPETKLDSVNNTLVPNLEENGVKVLGIIPEARTLLTFTVEDLLRELDGELVTSGEYANQPLENVMVGALTLDSGLLYFNRKANKVVVTRGDRADIHLAALETPTRCLVCTGGTKPMPRVILEAEQKGIPVMVVSEDTQTTIANIENIFPKIRFQQGEKLERLGDLLEQNFDFKSLDQALGA